MSDYYYPLHRGSVHLRSQYPQQLYYNYGSSGGYRYGSYGYNPYLSNYNPYLSKSLPVQRLSPPPTRYYIPSGTLTPALHHGYSYGYGYVPGGTGYGLEDYHDYLRYKTGAGRRYIGGYPTTRGTGGYYQAYRGTFA